MTTQTNKLMPARQLSVIAVVLITLVALGLGLVLKNSVESQAITVNSAGGIQAKIPAGWVVQEGKGELAFNAYSPFKPYDRVTVFVLSGKEGIKLEDVAKERSFQLSNSLNSYRILDAQSIERKGKLGYKVRNAYIDEKGQGLPRVIEGVDYYFASSGKVIVITWRTDASEFDYELPRFLRVLDSIKYNPGG